MRDKTLTKQRELTPGIGDLRIDWARNALERGVEKTNRFCDEARERGEGIAAEMFLILRVDMEHALEELNKALVE